MRNPTLLRSQRALLKDHAGSTWTWAPCRCHSRSYAAHAVQYETVDPFAVPPTHTRKPFYVTTPIFYVNAAPHVGHMYAMVIADILKRWQQLRENPSLLVTGTDEHGLKVQRAAAKAGVLPKPFCDEYAEAFKSLAKKSNISYDRFIRTTDPEHEEAVRSAWYILNSKGLIYPRKHEGWYSVSDETFFPDSAVHLVLDPATGRKMMASIETGKEVEWTSEVNYHFRLSAFRDRLLDLYKRDPEWVFPSQRMDEVVEWVERGLEDLSISRPVERLSWGIRVPNDPTQTIYVWIDALINYITAAGFPWPPNRYTARGWPADVHVIGKDIMRFHCVYWPALLMALDVPVPSRILVHAHWTLGKQKMAKSTGIVVNPFFALDRFGVDVLRFFLAHDGRLAHDSEYSNEQIFVRYSKSLQNSLGNTASRLVRSKKWNVRKAVIAAHDGRNFPSASTHDDDRAQYQMLQYLAVGVEKSLNKHRFRPALHAIMNAIYATNGYMQKASPWTMEGPRLTTVVYLVAEALRIAGILLQPYMPGKATELLDMLGVEKDMRAFRHADVGADKTYGVPKVDIGVGHRGVLFPPIVSE